MPGPIDFLGACTFAVLALLKAFGGKWLCLRPFRIDVVVVVLDMGSALFVFGPVLVDAVDAFLVIDTGPKAFLTVDTGSAGCVVVLFSS